MRHITIWVCLLQLRDKEKAIECYQKAIDIKPDYHEAIHFNRMDILAYFQFEKAKEYFQSNMELTEQQHSHAAMNLGHVFLLG
jgi:tetratricopeptide (TPR) repeat protein